MARTKKTIEAAVAEATTVAQTPKRRGRPPKNQTAVLEAVDQPKQKTVKKVQEKSSIKTNDKNSAVKENALKTASAPVRKKAGRPKKEVEPASPAREVEKIQKPGLITMAPLTKAKAVRRSELFKISDEPDRKRGRPAKKVMPVQQEQILAEELNLKVLADDRPGVQKRRKSAAASEAPGIPKQMPQPEKLAERMASPPRGRGRPPKQQVVSVPPAIITARRNRKLRTAAFAVIVLVVCAVGGYIYTSHKPVEAVSNDSKLIQQVAAKAVLPTDESPSISTVVNATAVNQPFLKGAKNGDKVLLYFQAGRAIVFRPSTGQVVNMGALQEPQPKVFIRSGSPDADTSKIGAEIAASGDFDIASRDQSPVNNYTKTIVVDVAGNRPDIANQLANVLHATVAKLPDGESAPDADLLVIVGSDNPVK